MKFTIAAALAAVASAEVASKGTWPVSPKYAPVVAPAGYAPAPIAGPTPYYASPLVTSANVAGQIAGNAASDLGYAAGSFFSIPVNFFAGAIDGGARAFAAGVRLPPLPPLPLYAPLPAPIYAPEPAPTPAYAPGPAPTPAYAPGPAPTPSGSKTSHQ